jgi:hypothetical protein
MSLTIPTVAKLTAAGTAIGDYLKSIHDWLDANPGNFTISNLVGGSSPTSFTLTHVDGWQINYRIDAGVIRSLIAPVGGISDSASPGTPTNAQPEDIVCPSPSGTSTTLHIARYEDALLIGINATGNTHWAYGWHQGRIALPDDTTDAALGADGLGTLAYLPVSSTASTNFAWFGITSIPNKKSYIRVGASVWGNLTTTRDIGSAITVARATKRFMAAELNAVDSGSINASTAIRYGSLKYIRADAGAALAPLQVVPSFGSDQAWMAINGTNNTTRMRCLWNKTVAP